MEDNLSKKSSRWWPRLRALFGLFLGGIFLYFVLQNIDAETLLNTFHHAEPAWLILLVPLILVGFLLRSFRWWLMLPSDLLLTKRVTFDAFMIGSLGNCILPGRLGDILRAAVLGRKSPAVGTTGALASIVLEKVLDGLVLLILLGLILLIAPFPKWFVEAGMIGAGVFGFLLSGLLVVSSASSNEAWMRFVPATGMLSILRLMIKKIGVGLHGLKSPRRFIFLLLISFIIWALEVTVVLISFSMFAISLPLIAACVTVVFLSLAMMLPAAPGFVGTYQFFVVSALALFQVNESAALALGIGLNLLIIVVTILVGIGALLLEGGPSGAFGESR